MNKFKAWLRWLIHGQQQFEKFKHDTDEAMGAIIKALEQDREHFESEARKLRGIVAELKLERYVPPSQPEPPRKIVPTQTMREFNAILEREMDEREQNAIG